MGSLELTERCPCCTGLYLPTGGVGELCMQLQAKLLTFEAMLAKTAVRRLLCISQVHLLWLSHTSDRA